MRPVHIAVLTALLYGLTSAVSVDISGSLEEYLEYTSADVGEGVSSDLEHFLTFTPRLWVGGVPLDFRVLVSSWDTPGWQPADRFGFRTDLGWLRVHAGDETPRFSRLTLGGTNLRGGGFGLRLGGLRFAVAGGLTERATRASDSTEATLDRWLYAVKVGWGCQEGSHVHLNLLSAWDVYDSSIAWSGDTVEVLTPRKNRVIGLDVGLSLFGGLAELRSEIAGSAFDRDGRSPGIEVDGIPGFLGPTVTSEFDIAYEAGLDLAFGQTRMGLEMRQVGAGFRSLGRPYLDRDVREIAFGIHQGWFRDRLSLSLRHGWSVDDLSGLNGTRTESRSTVVYLTAAFPGYPGLTLGISPYYSRDDEVDDSLRMDQAMDAYSASLWHTFSLFGIAHAVDLSASLSELDDRNVVRGDSLDYTTWTVNTSVSHDLPIPLSVGWGASLTSDRRQDRDERLWIYRASLGYRFPFWSLSLTLGTTYSREDGGAEDTGRFDLGCFANASIPGLFDVHLRAKRFKLEDPGGTGYLLGLTLSRTF
jgi:hypothetical protein